MPRIRTIKPEWLMDEALASESDTVRMLSVGLILLADDYGRGRAAAAYLRSNIWPYEDPPRTLSNVLESLQRLTAIRFIELYETEGQHYYQIRTWKKHQRIDNAGKSTIPIPQSAATRGEIPRDSASCGETRNFAAGSGPGKGPGKGKDLDLDQELEKDPEEDRDYCQALRADARPQTPTRTRTREAKTGNGGQGVVPQKFKNFSSDSEPDATAEVSAGSECPPAVADANRRLLEARGEIAKRKGE